MNFVQRLRQAGVWALGSLIFCLSVAVSASDVYSWTDANGVLHFSDKPPQTATPSLQVVPLPRHLNKSSSSGTAEVAPQTGTESQEKSVEDESQKQAEENSVSSNQSSQKPKTPQPPLTRSQRLEQKKEKRTEVMRSRFERTRSSESTESSAKPDAVSGGQNPPQQSHAAEQADSQKEEKPSFDWNNL